MYKQIRTIIAGLPMFMSTSQDIATLSKEVATNGGSSLKDAVLRNEAAAARIEELLSRLAAKQSHIWKNNPSPSFYADPTGLITEANSAFQELVNRDEDQLTRYGWLNCIAVDKRQAVWAEWEQAIKQGRTFEMETTFQNNGNSIPVLIRAVPILINTDVVTGYDGLIKVLQRRN